jgi:hypothetical protein
MNTKQFQSSSCKCGNKYFWLLIAVVALASFSFGQTIPGKLTSVATTTHSSGCETGTTTTYAWTFTDPQGGTHTFPGGTEVYIVWISVVSGSGTRECLSDHGSTSQNEWSTDGLYYLEATGASGSVTLASGYLNPKYLIMGVTYAPPGGNTSYASYADTNFVGNTSTNTSSFSQNYTESVSVSEGTCQGAAGSLSGFQAGVCVTGSQSNAWTIASNSTNTITISKQTSTTFKAPGTPNVYSPVDHDYDIIWLWLNPVVTFTVPGTNTSSSGSITWTGYGYDYNDPLHEIDIWPVYVGTLNGDFGTSFDCGGVTEPIDCQDAGVFARSWVTTQTFASGQGPGITTADYPNILGADPFAKNPAYVVTLESGTNPLTTTDGRFTQAGVNGIAPQTIPYAQAKPDSTTGENEMYQNTYVHTSTVGEGGSYTYAMGFGLEEKFGGSFFGLGVVYDFKQNWTFTWEDTRRSRPASRSTRSQLNSPLTRTTSTERSCFGPTPTSA